MVTVHFIGICTHFSREKHPQLGLPAAHRVVLVNALFGSSIDRHFIEPHIASVTIGGERILLDGCRLRLITPLGERIHYDETFGLVPNLTALVQQYGEELAPASPLVVTGSDRSRAALYFDFDAGTLSAALHTGAVVTKVTVQSPAVLEATPFPGRSLPDGLPPRQELHDSAEIFVRNADVDPADKQGVDFLLHYRTSERMPPNPPVPAPEELLALPQALLGNVDAIGSGCSNSNYP